MDIQRKNLVIKIRMNSKIIILIGLVIVSIILIEVIGPGLTRDIPQVENSNEEEIPNNKIKLFDENSLFELSTDPDHYLMINGFKQWYNLDYDFLEENQELYETFFPDHTKQNTVVIYSLFTATAYSDFGFYDYYLGNCDESCLTVPLTTNLEPEMGLPGLKILNLLGYKFVKDTDVDKNPEILKNYDKVILLHNEYVTQKEFDAITSHPNVIYLYPNALYAEIDVNYETNEIKLVRGHGYPEENIANGFDWEFDNTPLEYDIDCNNWEFYEIDNGWMLNCYPDRIFWRDALFLQTIRDL